MSAEDLQQEEKKERASLDKISENEAVEVLLDTFDYWVNEYAMHLKVGIIKENPRNPKKEKEDFNQKRQTYKSAILKTWQNITSNLVISSDESLEQIRAKLDELCGLHIFLEPFLRGKFKKDYGLGSLKTGVTKQSSQNYKPRELHTKLILSKVQNGISNARDCWKNLIYEGKNGNLIVEGDIVEINSFGKKNDQIKLKTKRIDEYEIDYETFARNFSYILNK